MISTEGLIGFKLQGWVNDPRRTQDLEDIRALLRANRRQLDMNEVRGYLNFSLGNRCSINFSANQTDQLLVADGGIKFPVKVEDGPFRTLDDLMAAIEVLCPTWPQREVFRDGGRMLL